MQRILGKITAIFAERILKSQWDQLSEKLKYIYSRNNRKKGRVPPKLVQQLLIFAEDRRFFQHSGFDIIAIFRAIWKRLSSEKREGASTIEQQIVRVVTGRYERTLSRKISEILLATLVTRVISKNELPALYLKIAYFGWRMNGFDEACKRLNLHYHSISLNEAASLVARLKYPEPQIAPLHRLNQIYRRRVHLIKLYQKHAQRHIYALEILEVKHAPV